MIDRNTVYMVYMGNLQWTIWIWYQCVAKHWFVWKGVLLFTGLALRNHRILQVTSVDDPLSWMTYRSRIAFQNPSEVPSRVIPLLRTYCWDQVWIHRIASATSLRFSSETCCECNAFTSVQLKRVQKSKASGYPTRCYTNFCCKMCLLSTIGCIILYCMILYFNPTTPYYTMLCFCILYHTIFYHTISYKCIYIYM